MMRTTEGDVSVESQPNGAVEERGGVLRAARDLGFMGWLFLAIVGGPSVLSLVDAAFENVVFSAPLEALLDGYQRLLRVVALILEPLADQVMLTLRAWLDVDWTLSAHWRPLFVLMLIFISANARSLWSDGFKGASVLFAIITACAAFLGCVISGLAPADGAPLLLGAIAAQLVALTMLGNILSYALAAPLFGLRPPHVSPLGVYALRGALMAALVFAAAVALAMLAPGATPDGGFSVGRPDLTALFGGMALYGAFWTLYGLVRSDLSQLRFGLRVFGGFLLALVIFLADAALR
ncbi:MAG: hypothetical protein AAF909_10285 [Pseudomonadota bacterium]